MERKDESYTDTHKSETVHSHHKHVDGNCHSHHEHIDGSCHSHHKHIDGTCHSHHAYGHHVHSEEEKKAVRNRLARAIGHLESVKRMVENDMDCSEVLIQLAAVRSAINNTGKLILKNHINECIVEAVEHGDHEAVEKLNEAIDKFMK